MEDNLSKYRLNEEAELDRFRSPDPKRFFRFQLKVYTLLDNICVNGAIDVTDAATPESIEVFIKVVCLYILMERRCSKPEDSYIEFSSDYRQILRKPGFKQACRKPHFYSRKG